ncbi:hypothetical protein EXU30_07990 [Shewanella maritima]|uniref:Uncharacterized protein n=1 Tax=Shewanella maritima TaxID=2520507 RepID=A0A411PGB0_9GAMM|nr:hypothetical protein [Shewanella maritima]QBF82636.1 hypothetical protein EXU30_07990 [Shewanella maritima]
MKIQIIVALLCFAVFGALLPGSHYVYATYCDTMAGFYLSFVVVMIMWISLFAGFASLFFHKLKALYQSVIDYQAM